MLKDRTKTERENDLVLIARMYLDGKTQHNIKDELARRKGVSVSIGTVNRDIKELLTRWRTASDADIREAMARDLARLADIEARASDSFERSLKTSERKTFDVMLEEAPATEASKSGSVTLVPRKRESTTKEERDGDPRWLAIILDCIKQRKEILGYAKPQKLQLEGGDKPLEISSDITQALLAAYGPEAVKPEAKETAPKKALPAWQNAVKK